MTITNTPAFIAGCLVGAVILALHIFSALTLRRLAPVDYAALVLHLPLLLLLCFSGVGLEVALCVMLVSFLVYLGSDLVVARVRKGSASTEEGDV